jgi:hypothetical protein
MKAPMLLALTLIAALFTPARSDDWAAPTPRVFGSPSGLHGFKVLKPKFDGISVGVLFRLDADGKEQTVWRAKLVNTPHRVIVDDSGKFVATIDTYGNLGFAHAIVVYGDKGKVIGDYKLEELLTSKEIESHVPHSESSRHWASKASFQIEDGHLAARLEWGKTIRVDLSDGKIAASDARKVDGTRTDGLIGTAQKNGAATGIAYHYPHGKVFPPALIRDRFHDGEQELPSVQIDLVGYVELAEETLLEIHHAAGGVNRDHGTLYIDDRQIGQVGDDLAKNVVYTLTLPKGTHKVRWVLTGGTFQPNLLRFQKGKSGELLTLFHTQRQLEETGAAKAVKTIEAQGEVEGWPPAISSWKRVPIE